MEQRRQRRTWRRVLIALACFTCLALALHYTGALEELGVEFFVRQPLRDNAEKQLAPPPIPRRPLDFAPFESALGSLSEARAALLDATLPQATIFQIQEDFRSGKTSAYELALYYLRRIKLHDGSLNSVTELNPDALAIAKELDAERASAGVRGALHGIPVLLKDNVATGDRMHTTAGAKAMEHARAPRDAAVVESLRRAGAVLLGKTALSEWANVMSSEAANGYSVLGGQVRNPYGPYDVSGSSSGSAVAIAANFGVVAVGSETWGSLISPANQNSVVAIKPTVGLVSGDGIIPVTDAQDTAGPMARTVADAAVLLSVMARSSAPDASADFTVHLKADGLRGLRVGLARMKVDIKADNEAQRARIRERLRELGATVVELPPVSLLSLSGDLTRFRALAEPGFKRGLNAYLREFAAPVPSLEGVIEFNTQDPAQRAPYGQDLLDSAQESSVSNERYAALVRESRTRAVQRIDSVMAEHRLDLLLEVGFVVTSYAAAAYPAICVPAGYRPDGEPVGVTFIGKANSEPVLIGAAYAFEQATRARRDPG